VLELYRHQNQKEHTKRKQQNNMAKEKFQLAKPLADRVLIEVETEVKQTSGGIIIPETAQSNDTKIGIVVSVGNGIYTNDGVKIPMEVKVGDKVMMPMVGSAQKVKLENKDYYLFREQELLMIIK
jgi:chaperonin GroES